MFDPAKTKTNPLTFLLSDTEIQSGSGRAFEALVSELKAHPGTEAKMQLVESPVTDPAAGFRTIGEEYLVACIPGLWRWSPPQSDSPSYALRLMQRLARMGGFGYTLTDFFLGGQAYVVYTESTSKHALPGLPSLTHITTLGSLAPTIWDALQHFRHTREAERRQTFDPFRSSQPFGPFGPTVHMIHDLADLERVLNELGQGGMFGGFSDYDDQNPYGHR